MSLYIPSNVLRASPLTLFSIPSLFDYDKEGKIYLHELLPLAPIESVLQIAILVEGEQAKAAIRSYGLWCCSFVRPMIKSRKVKQLLDVAQNVTDGLYSDAEETAANEEARSLYMLAPSSIAANAARIAVEATMPLPGKNPRYAYSLELLCNSISAYLAAYDETGLFKHFKTIEPIVLERTLKEGRHRAKPFGFGKSASSSVDDYYS